VTNGKQLSEAERAPAVAIVRREVARACDGDGVLCPGESIVLACSGGVDSTAMLDVCIRLAPPRNWRLHVVHIDHGLRQGSREDAGHIERTCREAKIGFTRRAVVVEPGTGIPAKAREARYQALREIAADVGASVIATAHTADDQAETVLMRALAQATPKSLTGIDARRDDLVRPLLGVWREQTVAYCRALGLEYFEDPANQDPRYTRARVRHEVMPALEAVFPAARRRLVELAKRQRTDRSGSESII
jgi:tRNA(Ile)-lysidine synthase